jgi:murein DD-endopeptidase MepM/ murein hydrolase activator NlpD
MRSLNSIFSKLIVCLFLVMVSVPIAKSKTTCVKQVCVEVINLKGDVLEFFAINKLTETPVSLDINVKKKNLKTSGDSGPFVISGGERRYLFTLYTDDDGSRWKYNYEFLWNKGDFNAKHDSTHRYRLPFAKNAEYKINQSCFGDFSHENKNSLDFALPEGTAVHAARRGKVVGVKEDSSINGDSMKYAKHGNYLIIQHRDKTLASYYHLKYQGVIVKEGDYVVAGQHIAYSGNTGFSNGPHLHFEVYKGSYRGIDSETIPIFFKTSNGEITCPPKGKIVRH